MFDPDVAINESVRKAREELARELTQRHASVLFADMPRGVSCGIDDYLGSIENEKGLDAAIKAGLKIFEIARPAKFAVQPQSERLLACADDIEVFHTADNDCYASVEIDGHIETHSLRQRSFREYLARVFYKAEGKGPSAQAVQDAIDTLSGKAKFDGAEMSVNVRIASANGKIYIDLCNDTWQIVEVTKEGYTVIESKDAPVRFRRPKGMRSLPTPTGNGDVSLLKRFLNLGDVGDGSDVGDVGFQLILSWLVACFRPDMPFPILSLSGGPGTAKSTATRVCKELTDPSNPPHRSCPRNEHELMIAASNSWLCSFDNISSVPDWLSDAMCRISTGGGFATRELYKDDEETLFNAKRPILLNGIGSFATRSDLIDRAVVVELKPIGKSQRKSERQFWAEFELSRTAIFTGLLAGVACALKNIDSVVLSESSRMADFTEWATAAETGLGFAAGSFLDAYKSNRDSSHSIVLEGSTLAEVLQEYCDETVLAPVPQMLLKDLLTRLKERADKSPENLRSKRKDFPKSSKGLRNELQRLDPNLREIGITIVFLGKVGDSARHGASVSLDYDCKSTSPTSPTSPAWPETSMNVEVKACDVGCDVTCDVGGRPRGQCRCRKIGFVGDTCEHCGEVVPDWADLGVTA